MADVRFTLIFSAFLLLCIFVDLFLHKGKNLTIKEALTFSGCWLLVAVATGVAITRLKGYEAGLAFTAGYLIELSLSVDNLFVFLALFHSFHLSLPQQHTILFWGIIGALILRGLFIICGITLVAHYHWILYLFGLFLVVTGLYLWNKKPGEAPSKKWHEFFAKYLPVTPLFLALITVELTDMFFALDSIPAVFGVTLDPVIVYTSNACAIVGLRSFYFALQHLMGMFQYLHKAVCAILIFIGCKMVIAPWYTISIEASLIMIGIFLITAIACSKR